MSLQIRENLRTVNLERGMVKLHLLKGVFKILVKTSCHDVNSLIGSSFKKLDRLLNQNIAGQSLIQGNDLLTRRNLGRLTKTFNVGENELADFLLGFQFLLQTRYL